MSQENKVVAHGAHTGYMLRKQKTILRLLPFVLEKSNAQLAGTVMILLILTGGGIGAGIVIDGYGLQGQVNVIWHCPPPLVIRNNGCYQEISSTINSNGKNVTTTNYVLAGTYSYPNGSEYK